ncbi:hypothetical protein UY286_24600 [Paenibacillus polymyxa]|uniref:Uncharacterized protein n=1 Tax=Paenibacillus polymyxa TaxID=1406 RepID=A0AAE9PRD0_PAEPO|nr:MULTISPECIES: hypothetical protein [Paenibacillus]MDY8120599.1 hypothetical protein [Paenibacillus polymyxa]
MAVIKKIANKVASQRETSESIKIVCKGSCNRLHKTVRLGETPSLIQINDIGCMMIGAAQWFEI